MKQSPIFARTHDLVLWLLERSESFPRSQRFVLTSGPLAGRLAKKGRGEASSVSQSL